MEVAALIPILNLGGCIKLENYFPLGLSRSQLEGLGKVKLSKVTTLLGLTTNYSTFVLLEV